MYKINNSTLKFKILLRLVLSVLCLHNIVYINIHKISLKMSFYWKIKQNQAFAKLCTKVTKKSTKMFSYTGGPPFRLFG